MPNYIANDMKRFAHYIEEEAKADLSKHISKVENFFFGVTQGRYSVEIYGENTLSAISPHVQELKFKLKRVRNIDELQCYKKALHVLNQWEKLGYVPKEYRFSYVRFCLKDAVPTDLKFEVSCLASFDSVMRLANKIKKYAGKPCSDIQRSDALRKKSPLMNPTLTYQSILDYYFNLSKLTIKPELIFKHENSSAYFQYHK